MFQLQNKQMRIEHYFENQLKKLNLHQIETLCLPGHLTFLSFQMSGSWSIQRPQFKNGPYLDPRDQYLQLFPAVDLELRVQSNARK